MKSDDCDFGDEICKVIYKKQSISISSLNGLTTREPMKIRVGMPEEMANEFSNVQLLLQGKTMYMGIVQMDLQKMVAFGAGIYIYLFVLLNKWIGY